MPFLWLTVFLMTLVHLQPSNQDPVAPIHNIRVDTRRGILMWDLTGTVDEIKCNKSQNYLYTAKNNTYCQIYAFSLCTATNYTIRVTKGPSFSTWIQYPAEEGKPGTTAENLTCWIHDKDFLQCSWAVGWAAPRDVQYYLYLKDNRQEHKCLRYRKDMQGRHVGCYFDNISKFASGLYQFIVNGTSKASGISCTEIFKSLSQIEVISPPNITGWCNKSYSFMEWEIPSHLNKRLSYELEIQKSTDPANVHKVKVNENYTTQNHLGSYTVKIRAQLRNTYSAWSAPQKFDCDKEEEPSVRAWRTWGLSTLGVLLALLLAALLCRRCSVMQKIYPRIPRVKDLIKTNLQNESTMVWETDRAYQDECPVHEVQVLEKS
ncbi:interleukin-3 receptor subunit alpha isoform X2 [Tamandua tetradactyla]